MEVGRIGVLAVPLHRKSALCWDQQRLGKSIDRKYPPALLKWNHAVSDGCGRQTARRRCLDRVRVSARCRNGWGPGGSNPKVAQSCWHVYVVDLVRLEMGPSVYGGTGRLPLLSSSKPFAVPINPLYIICFFNNSFGGGPVSENFRVAFWNLELLRIDTTAQRRVNPELW